MIVKAFEVKTGKNKGFYIAIHQTDKVAYKKLAKIWGIINPEYNYDFYRYHGLSTRTHFIWTHSCWPGQTLREEMYHELIKTV